MVITTTTIKSEKRGISNGRAVDSHILRHRRILRRVREVSRRTFAYRESHKTPKTTMEMSYIMTIAVFFHLSNQRYFKWHYKNFICGDPRIAGFFGKLVSYNRFVELMPTVAAPLTLYLIGRGLGKCSGISFLDSTAIDVCDVRRMYSHKVFAGLATKGKSSTG